jgi:two-component system sporulation sensor kinase A
MLNTTRQTVHTRWDRSAVSFLLQKCLLQKIHFIPKRFVEILAQAELGRLYTGVLHDLSNPITALMLYLQNQTQTPNHELITTVASEIKNVLQTARNTAHANERGVVSVSETIQHAHGLLSYRAMQAGVRIVTFVEHDTLLYGKKLALQQIITNLLSNAIDAYVHCPTLHANPSVTITATATSSAPPSKRPTEMQITVHDFGCGIPPEKIKRIFKPFYTTKSTGTGIGLTLVKQLVRREFGGTLEVMSSVNTGTYFIVRIPLPRNSPQS